MIFCFIKFETNQFKIESKRINLKRNNSFSKTFTSRFVNDF